MSEPTIPPSRPKARFLLVGPLSPPVHGQSLAFEMLCCGLRTHNYDCRVVNIQGKKRPSLGRFTIARSIETLYSLRRFVGGLIAGYHRVYITVSRSRAGFTRDMLMIWGARLCGGYVIAHVAGGNYDEFYRTQPQCWRFVIRHTLRRTHRIIVLSERLRAMFAFDPTLSGRISVVWNGMPSALNDPPPSRQLSKDRPVQILFLSNLIQSKGYFEVLEALTILRKTTAIRLKAVFAGHFLSSADDLISISPEEAEIKFHKYVAANGLEDVARYAGPITGEAKRALLEASDFFLLPTRYFTEGQPLSIIEAMAYGCIVISTNYRAIPDLVVDGVTGVLIKSGRPDQIADIIQRIVAHPHQYERMSRAAIDRYQKCFTMQRHLDTIIPLLARGEEHP